MLALHGQLAPAAWAAARGPGELRVGYVQTTGGALPGSLSEDVAELRNTGLLSGHVTAGAAYGGEVEALTVIGALEAAAGPLGWDAVIAGPGPGIAGSGSELGHGGMAALDTAHASLILGHETLVAPRMSSGDPRERHRGLSHHTETVLRMLLGNVRVPAPARGPDRLPQIGGDDLPRPSCARRAATATRSGRARRRSTSTPRAACPRRTWAARSPTTGSSSRPRWRPATRWPRRPWRSLRRE